MVVGPSSSAAHDARLEETLASLLSSPSFTAASYLNAALAPPPGGDDGDGGDEGRALERRMASLALQLQMRTQSCHDEIGRVGAELSAVVPRCAADVSRLRAGLDGMETDVRGLLGGMSGVGGVGRSGGGGADPADAAAGPSGPDSSNDALSVLHRLLNLRTHLTTARGILSAASGWDETMDSVPSLLASSPPDLPGAVSALARLERGARALRGMPEGRAGRDEALARLRAQLEVLLRPQLLHALKRMDTRLGPLQQCVGMYRSLGRMDAMREEYVRMRPGEMHALWFSFGGSVPQPSSGGAGGGEGENDDGGEDDDEEAVEDFDFEDGADLDIAPSTPASARQFSQFLPRFYGSVLDLLALERQRSRQVFGPDLAPSIVVRVMVETFRPISASFGKRLGNLCPVPGTGLRAGSVEGGGTAAVAAAYGATLRFLSLAYESMDLGSAPSGGREASAGEGASASELLASVREAFDLVASPFAPYQRDLAEAERDPLGRASSLAARDVRGVSGMDGAAERMAGLAPRMFPLAEAAVDRFELLCGGYNAPATLSAVDALISGHASELAIAAGTLSSGAAAAAASGSGSSAPDLDERSVNSSLEILRTAGSFGRDLRSFESAVRDRLAGMADGLLDAPLDGPGDGGGSPSTLPDELSVAQIRAHLAGRACGPGEDRERGAKDAASELRRLAGPAGADPAPSSPPLFPRSRDSSSRLARGCLGLVFEVCHAAPEDHLRDISALPVWRKETPDDGADDDGGAYGILPQPYITAVGEHMLALVQALEPFASDPEALGLANEVMDGVLDVAVQPWREFVAAAGCSFDGRDDGPGLEALMRGRGLAERLSEDGGTSAAEEEEGGDDDDVDDDEDPAAAAFCNQWLDAVGLAATGRLLERTMRIPRLGAVGARHLAADLSYVMNVFTALGVAGHPHPLLGYVSRLVEMEPGELRSRIERRKGGDGGDASSEELEVIKRIELRIAYIRSV